MTEHHPRREFLKMAGAGVAAAAIGSPWALGSGSAGGGQFAGRIKRAVLFHMVEEKLSVTDKFKLLKDLGYDGVEIRRADGPEPREVVEARERTGLPIHGITNSSSPDIRGAIDLAQLYGAETVLLVAGRVNEKTAYDENYRVAQQRIRQSAPYAEQHRIKLLVENVWNNFLLSPLEMARYVDELASPWVGAYFDVGNVLRYGWPEQWIRILGRRIGKIHVKEYSRKKQDNEGLRKGFDVELGEGDCNWPVVRAALAEIDYRGWATAEVRGGDRARLKDIAERMIRVLDL